MENTELEIKLLKRILIVTYKRDKQRMENLTYEQAAQELDQILVELKSDKISIDKLAEKVERAAQLASFAPRN